MSVSAVASMAALMAQSDLRVAATATVDPQVPGALALQRTEPGTAAPLTATAPLTAAAPTVPAIDSVLAVTTVPPGEPVGRVVDTTATTLRNATTPASRAMADAAPAPTRAPATVPAPDPTVAIPAVEASAPPITAPPVTAAALTEAPVVTAAPATLPPLRPSRGLPVASTSGS